MNRRIRKKKVLQYYRRFAKEKIPSAFVDEKDRDIWCRQVARYVTGQKIRKLNYDAQLCACQRGERQS